MVAITPSPKLYDTRIKIAISAPKTIDFRRKSLAKSTKKPQCPQNDTKKPQKSHKKAKIIDSATHVRSKRVPISI
jgi:sRNA-binding carbon storage regulator CsrA